MFKRLCAMLLVALLLAAAASCGGSRLFGKQYEYEEDLTLSLDGTATLVLNASLASLAVLRGLPVPTDTTTRLKTDEIRAMFASPVTEVTRVSPAWRRKGRRFVQVRVKISDIRRLSEAAPFAWSTYALAQIASAPDAGIQGPHIFYKQLVGASAMRPGTLQNYGWDGSEIVAFRLHLPSKILYHNARDLESSATSDASRGNILAWEQHLSDRLDGRPVDIEVRMESQSILHRTLFLFAGAFLAALIVLALLIWWTVSKGKNSEHLTPNLNGRVDR